MPKLMIFLRHRAATFREGCRDSNLVCILSGLGQEAGGQWRQLDPGEGCCWGKKGFLQRNRQEGLER